MYTQVTAKIHASGPVKYHYDYECGCDILPEELGGCDAQKFLKRSMHHLIADHVPLIKCSRCSVFLPPGEMEYHRKYNCDDEKAICQVRLDYTE